MHGSVAVCVNDPTRYVAYAQFWPSVGHTPANAFDHFDAHMEKTSNAVDVHDDCNKAKYT